MLRLTQTNAAAPGGNGIVTEEQVQKGYVWMNEVNNNIFDATYDDIVAYFGVEGEFVKEEYSDHMKANYRYYKWISEDDDSHFIYVNFKENESGVYTVSAYNTSGFSGTEAIEKYLDIVKAEAAEANKAASANAEMKDFSVEIAQFAKDDVKVKIMTKIPVSGWSFDDSGRCLVENDDPTAFGAGAIRFEVRTNVEDFDYYKDDFENYQDIDDRVIGGITFKGRTYKHIGYNWIQYVAQIDDGRALSIGLTKLECVPGTMPDIILQQYDVPIQKTAPAPIWSGRIRLFAKKRGGDAVKFKALLIAAGLGMSLLGLTSCGQVDGCTYQYPETEVLFDDFHITKTIYSQGTMRLYYRGVQFKDNPIRCYDANFEDLGDQFDYTFQNGVLTIQADFAEQISGLTIEDQGARYQSIVCVIWTLRSLHGWRTCSGTMTAGAKRETAKRITVRPSCRRKRDRKADKPKGNTGGLCAAGRHVGLRRTACKNMSLPRMKTKAV